MMKRSLPFHIREGGQRAGLGFSLIELMIVVAIVAILAAIAVPAYSRYATRAHRVAAEACLSQYANYMERFYTTNLNYASDASNNAPAAANTFDCASAQQTGAFYSYQFGPSSPSSSAYVIQAVPINSQLTRDTQCGTVSLNQVGTRTITGSADVPTCWQQ
jgi:type IV pilus assembly protein PilE